MSIFAEIIDFLQDGVNHNDCAFIGRRAMDEKLTATCENLEDGRRSCGIQVDFRSSVVELRSDCRSDCLLRMRPWLRAHHE